VVLSVPVNDAASAAAPRICHGCVAIDKSRSPARCPPSARSIHGFTLPVTSLREPITCARTKPPRNGSEKRIRFARNRDGPPLTSPAYTGTTNCTVVSAIA